MKTLVIYTSQTGFTKKYAKWMAESMNADLFDVKDVQKKENSFFDEYDAIVYAGWFMAEKIAKVNWFLDKAQNWKDKQLAVVGVGGSPNEEQAAKTETSKVLTEEQSKYIKAFYCQGGFNYEKMSLPSRLMMKAYANSLKKSKNEKTREMGNLVDHSFDMSDRKFIEPVVEYIMGAMAKEA